MSIKIEAVNQEERTIIEGSAFSYNGGYYQLVKNDKKASALPKAKLTVLTSDKIGVKAMYSNVVYDTKQLKERPMKDIQIKARKEQDNKSKP